ncbi:uncharacterized protein LOC130727341 [Lotus japonicus]|uniref:uncharacterized protein LOC130727341 n=1 Tax=Lotus japonicus TaxID=34305 RepID=UPI00258AA5BC|nr:uncharacterized protein LOC130727341 [Lotus japonicus]
MSTQNGDDSSSSKSSSDPISTQTKQKPTDPDFINLKKAFDSVLKEVESCYVNWEVVNLLDRLHGHVQRDETIFHLALRQNHTRDLEEVVNNKYTEPQYLEIRNNDGNPAFHVAAMTGKWEFMRIMMNKNPNLPLIPGQDEMLPIHLAVLGSHRQIVNNLYTSDLLEKMSNKDIGQLFFMAFKNNMYDVAYNLTHMHNTKLIVQRDDDELTALHMLARKPPSEKNKYLQQRMILNLRGRFHFWFEYKEKLKLRTEPSVVVFDAIKSGNIHFLEVFLSMCGHPDYNSETKLWELKDPYNGQNILHIAVWYRQKSIMNFILDSWESKHTKHIVIQGVDKDSNNVLHFAARPPRETSASLRPDIQMKRELEWFEEVKKRVPPELNTMKNKDGKTPMDMLHAHHTNLSSEIKDTAKKVAESGMVHYHKKGVG